MIAHNDTPTTNDAPPAPKAPKQPTVETIGTYQPGQKVKHANGTTYIVRYQTPEGVTLEGVANPINPTALKPI
jgi:hypothetical protein